MSPQYRLYYFEFSGRGEPIRQLLHYAGQPFENCTMNREQWMADKSEFKKADCKYGQMPILEIDGRIQLSQSHAILRHLGEKFGLMPKEECEKAMADELDELNRDFLQTILPFLGAYCGWMPGDLKKLHSEVFVPSLERFLPFFENALLQTINSATPSGFLLPSGICYVDFVFSSTGNILEWLEPKCVRPYPTYAAYLTRMRALPQLKGHYANLPPNYHTATPGKPFNRPKM